MDFKRQLHLPLTQEFTEQLLKNNTIKHPEKLMVIGFQHYLKPTLDLLHAIAALGIPTDQIFCCGKNYSFCHQVHQTLLREGFRSFACPVINTPGTFTQEMSKLIKNLVQQASTLCRQKHLIAVIIISDGPILEEACQQDWGQATLACILQTASARYKIAKSYNIVPTVDIAYSAAKVTLELPFIAQTTIAALDKLLEQSACDVSSCGLVGVGNLGSLVLGHIQNKFPANEIKWCDNSYNQTAIPHHSINHNQVSLEHLIKDSQLIIGCTGDNVLSDQKLAVDAVLQGKWGNKTFASLSSGDYEFLSLLQRGANANGWQRASIDENSPDNLIYNTKNANKIKVLKGGYPINFDCSGVSVNQKFIQVTETLLLAAFVQMVQIVTNPVRLAALTRVDNPVDAIVELDSTLQSQIATAFLQLVDNRCEIFPKETHQNFRNLDWVTAHSQHKYSNTVCMPAALGNYCR